MRSILKVSPIVIFTVAFAGISCQKGEDHVSWYETLEGSPLAGIVTVRGVERCNPSQCVASRVFPPGVQEGTLDIETVEWDNKCLGESADVIYTAVFSELGISLEPGKKYAVSIWDRGHFDLCDSTSPQQVHRGRASDEIVEGRLKEIGVTVDEFLERCQRAKEKQVADGNYPLRLDATDACSVDAGAEDGG